MRRKIRIIFAGIVLLAGFLIFSWSDIYHMKVSLDNKKKIEAYQKTYGSTEKKSKETKEDAQKEKEDTVDKNLHVMKNEELYQAMQSYNQKIYENGQADLTDPWAYEAESMDLSEYGVKDGMIAVLSIPKMKVTLPVYLGATKEKMAKGAVMLGETSFPIEGTNSNCVIAAHRGWKGIPMFRDIEALEVGDIMTVQNCEETLTYQVTKLKVIMPDDSEYIMIQPGKNMLTLITCHPYRQHTRRYLVYCELSGKNSKKDSSQAAKEDKEKINASEKVRKLAIKEDGKQIELDTIWRKVVYILMGVISICIVTGYLVRRKREHKKR